MITVIDAMCGAGKSTKMFEMMREGNKLGVSKYLYITPFLSEIDERVPQELPELNFKSPVNTGNGKMVSLASLIDKGENVASTHALFSMLTKEIVDKLIEQKYTLVIDEAINCVGLLGKEFKVSDTKALLKSGMVIVDQESRGKLIWNEEDYPNHDGRYSTIRSMCRMEMLYCYVDAFVMFEYPPKLLRELENVYVLTYLFSGSDMRCWLDVNKIPYQFADNEAIGLRSEAELKAVVKENLIFLSNRNLDATSQRRTTLSHGWYDNAKAEEIKKYQAMLRSCVVSEKAKAGEIFWTTYKDCEKKMAGDGYRKGVSKDLPAFLPCNIRATNMYRNYSLCMYTINLFKNPVEVNYLASQGVKVDEDTFALSEAIQFIFRGCIRKGEPMRLLVLSKRVKKLLEDWLSES